MAHTGNLASLMNTGMTNNTNRLEVVMCRCIRLQALLTHQITLKIVSIRSVWDKTACKYSSTHPLRFDVKERISQNSLIDAAAPQLVTSKWTTAEE